MSENKQQATAPKNAVAEYRSGIVKIQETFVGMIIKNSEDMALEMDAYQIVCVKNAIAKMVELTTKENLDIKNIDPNNITGILQQVSMLRINLSAIPREGYIILRS